MVNDMRIIWSHNENKNIPLHIAEHEIVICKSCGAVNNKYIKSHYTGGKPCVILSKYCKKCGAELRR